MKLRTMMLICALPIAPVAPALSQDASRIATYNTQHLGPVGAPAWEDLVSVLKRVDAEVASLQEINSSDVARLDQLAQDAGYPYHALASISGTLSGYLRNAALSRNPITGSESWSAAELSGDPDANDITRDIFLVWVEMEAELAPWAILVVHLKAGTSETDMFRRQVEIERLALAVERVRNLGPGSPIVLTGDFNEDPRNGPFGTLVFDELPGDLPKTYRLGSDIAFPVTYDPFATLEAKGLTRLEATHEDDPDNPVTHPATNRILDLLWLDQHLVPEGTEVYDSCDDNGVDDPPPGHWLEKAGNALTCGVSSGASDHLDLFGNLLPQPTDQDLDGVDDSIDCAPLDPSAGRPREVSPLSATHAEAGGTLLSWPPEEPADRYDLLRGALGSPESGECRTHLDPDPTDTEFLEDETPSSGTGWHYLVRAIDDACGGPGPWGSSSLGEGCP